MKFPFFNPKRDFRPRDHYGLDLRIPKRDKAFLDAVDVADQKGDHGINIGTVAVNLIGVLVVLAAIAVLLAIPHGKEIAKWVLEFVK